MKKNRDQIIKETLKHEGGYVNHPRDPGGETNYGITKAVARENGYTGSMKTIPMSLVLDIYAKKYWKTPYYNCDNLNSGVDYAVYDFGVNSGPSRAYEYLMKSIGGTDKETINKIYDLRLAFLKRLRTWPTFGKGWERRCKEGRAFAIKLAKEQPTITEEKKIEMPQKEIKTATVKQGTIAALIAAAATALFTWWNEFKEFISELYQTIF